MNYLLTYKLSQDHLELFFGAVCSAGSFKNNATKQPFTEAYKRLMLRSHIERQNGNCEKRDPIEILSAVSNSSKINGNDVTMSTAALIQKYDMIEKVPTQSDHDYCEMPIITSLSEYKTATISQNGFVAKTLQIGSSAKDALGSQNGSPCLQHLQLKDKGKLFKHSQTVVSIC